MASSFVDKARITVHAGKGGDGAVAFHREKYVAAGGPDGGDGGRGGNVVFVVDDNMSTLMDFRYKRKYTAGNGANGQGKRCYGKDGETLYIKVPRGTIVRDTETGAIMHDMSTGENWVAAKGGRGGWGNMHFATPTRQVPRFAKPGLPGESHDITLELKLLADVGLVGFPNVGKSTLLSVVSKAHPKIANYHFTTLFPNLGVVYVDEGVSFVMADIPGIIEGASEGKGLGLRFLRHIERNAVLLFMIPADADDIKEQYRILLGELEKFNPQLMDKHRILAISKCDMLDEELSAAIEADLPDDIPHVMISAVTGQGISELKDVLWRAVTDDANRLATVDISQRDLDDAHRVGEEDEFIFAQTPEDDEDEDLRNISPEEWGDDIDFEDADYDFEYGMDPEGPEESHESPDKQPEK